MLKFLILFTALALVHGNAISKTARAGIMNKYFVYHRDNPTTAVPILEFIAGDPGFDLLDPALNTMVIVHGHEEDATSNSVNHIKMGLISGISDHGRDEYNVLAVDYSSYTKQSYSVAVNAVPSCGHYLGEFLVELLDELEKGDTEADGTPILIPTGEVHLVGFGIGAHVVGFAGRRMTALGRRPGRITGLDPTGKNWGSGSQRLSANDATYVEVIHTDGSGILANGIGTAIGHVDFFINGGGNQPGCLSHTCSQERAFEIMSDTLRRDDRLVGNLCATNLQLSTNKCKGFVGHVGGLGFARDKIFPHGIYRVNTKRSPPY